MKHYSYMLLLNTLKRIYNWVKNHSEKRTRQPVAPKLVPAPSAGRKERAVTAFDVFRSSHDDRPAPELLMKGNRKFVNMGKLTADSKVVFDQLPGDDVKALAEQARQVTAERQAAAEQRKLEETPESIRARHVV